MILWPWRKGRLGWRAGIGGVRCTDDFDYRVESYGGRGWFCDHYPSGHVWGSFPTRRAAMRACELHAMKRPR